jgi:kynureninase
MPLLSIPAAEIAALDAADPLAPFRSRFVHSGDSAPQPEHAANGDGAAARTLIYLDGNSLGRLPLATRDLLSGVVDGQWGSRLIRSWSEGWFTLPERVGEKIGTLLGAQPGELIVADSTSVNLFKLATAALRLQAAAPTRTRILTDDMQFPSDLYILQGIIDLLGGRHTLEIVPSPDEIHGPAEALTAALDERVALVCLSHTVFKSAYTYDMAAISAAAHAVGALTLWDLSHAAGSVPVDLTGAHADLAVGCTYKYLNGGPGAPAFLYVRRDLQERLINPISGWMGQRNLFAFEPDYHPAPGLRHFLTGTPPVLSTAAIEPGVDLLLEAGMAPLRAKSLALTDLFIRLWEHDLAPRGYTLKTPLNPAVRGSHIALGHPEAWRISQALGRREGVLPDFRRPDNIRLGIAPLYNRFADVAGAVESLVRIVDDRLYEAFPLELTTVT